jgi:4-hydroxybenzoate polyprenyltransferase
MFIYQHLLVKPNYLSKVNIAFMTANGIASSVFSVFVSTALVLQILGNIPSAVIH